MECPCEKCLVRSVCIGQVTEIWSLVNLCNRCTYTKKFLDQKNDLYKDVTIGYYDNIEVKARLSEDDDPDILFDKMLLVAKFLNLDIKKFRGRIKSYNSSQTKKEAV